MSRHPLPADLRPELVEVVIDSREQDPWPTAPMRSFLDTLDSGDYSVAGLEHVVRIERKSLPDLVACCGTERERFEREIVRLLGFPSKALIVEASWAQIEVGGWRSQVKPSSVVGSLLGWAAMGLPVICAGSRDAAAQLACRMLYIVARRRWREARALVAIAVDAAEMEGAAS